MNITDYLFMPLIIVTMGLYFILPKRFRWIWLLIISLLFFATWGVELLPVVCLIVLITWIASLRMEKKYESSIVEHNGDKELVLKVKKENKYILIVSISLILLLLVYIKLQRIFAGTVIVQTVSDFYSGIRKFLLNVPGVHYFVSAGDGNGAIYLDNLFFKIMGLPEKELQFTIKNWIIPLGISYYTLSLVGYLADVYWRKEKAEKNFFKLLLFTLYFPKILEGPISKYRNVSEQLYEGHSFDYNRVCFGLQRVIWGFFKKLVIADRLSFYVNEVFGNYILHYGSEFVVAAVLGAIQLYCDFSGCMDIGLGISECFGITLEENFNHPFNSRSAAEFWRRWHITLGIWFKDYIYMPLSVNPRLIKMTGKVRKKFGKRAGKNFSTVIPLVCVWILTGLWHGTGINYIIWGAYWGILIILSNIFEPQMKKFAKLLKVDIESKGYILFQKVGVFLLFVISRIITLSKSVDAMLFAFKRIFTDFAPWKFTDGSLFSFGVDRPKFLVVIISIFFLGFISNRQENGIHIREWIANRPLPIRWIIYYAAIFAVLIFGAYGSGYDAGAFVYMTY